MAHHRACLAILSSSPSAWVGMDEPPPSFKRVMLLLQPSSVRGSVLKAERKMRKESPPPKLRLKMMTLLHPPPLPTQTSSINIKLHKPFKPEGKSSSLPELSKAGKIMDDGTFYHLATELQLDVRWRPLVEYLHSLGVEKGDLEKIACRHITCLQTNVNKAKERFAYLRGLGVKEEDMRKILLRHPQILEYTVKGMMKPRIDYLRSIGIPDSKLRKVLIISPSVLECSLEKSLKPKVKFLLEELHISQHHLWKIIVLSPQVLTQNIELSLKPRVDYLVNELGASQEALAKMITKHPQLLHYSVEDGIMPRIKFLRGIGMTGPDILKVLSRFSQILSLSVEKSLQPKYVYLIKELKCGLQTAIRYPAYFSLSFHQRIRPRHKFLAARNKLPTGTFSMSILAVTDQEFCRRWAKSTLEEYYSFRHSLMISNFAKEFERKNRL